jgi:leucyl aminopeptidase
MGRAAVHGVITARGANLARELQARPGNIATPTFLAERAQEVGERHGIYVTVLDRAGIREEGMHALLAVAQGSAEEPRFIVMEYQGGKDGEAARAGWEGHHLRLRRHLHQAVRAHGGHEV